MSSSDTLVQRDGRVLWHPYTAQPVRGPQTAIARAEGAFLYTEDGHRLFDGTSSWWSQIHGHCHPRLVEALHRQAQKLDQILFAPHTHETAVELAEGLVRAYGSPLRRVFYSDDGSTAVEAGLKMAAQYFQNRGETSRRFFLSIEEGYHGDTLGAISVGYLKEFHHYFDRVIRPSFKSTLPYCYRCPLGKSYPDCDVACLGEAERILEESGEHIAALIVEPRILGAAGMISYPTEYLEKLIRMCRQKGILIVFDEVFTGFGRTGPFFAGDAISERPDIVCLSKGLTSGMMALGVTLATEEIYEAFVGGEGRKFYHGHTFTANGLACAVALESLRMFEEQAVLARNRLLERVLEEAGSRFREHPHVGDVRHLGMILALEIVEDRASKAVPQPRNQRTWRVAADLWEKGVWIRPMGNVIYLVPPYCATPADLQEAASLMYGSLNHEYRST